MLRRLQVSNFKALRNVDVHLDTFHVLVGANATGKSTAFEVLQLLRDLILGGVNEALYGEDHGGRVAKRASHPSELTWLRRGGQIQIALTLELPEAIAQRPEALYTFIRFELSIDTATGSISAENVWLIREEGVAYPKPSADGSFIHVPGRHAPKGWRKIISKAANGSDRFQSETTSWTFAFKLGENRSALGNLPEDEDKFAASIWLKRWFLDGLQPLSLDAEALRLPALFRPTNTLQPDGSNLPWIIHALEEQDPEALSDWMDQVRSALPELRKVETRERPEDRSRYVVLTYRSGLEAPAWLLSDGTLRLLALTLLAYMPQRPSMLLIEEPENGIHPYGLQTVLQSLENVYDAQVFCATHSPLVLSLLDKKHLLCFSKDVEGAVEIIMGPKHPRLQAPLGVDLGALFATGVLG